MRLLGARILQCDTSARISFSWRFTLRCSHWFMLREATSAQVPLLTFFFSIDNVYNHRGLDHVETFFERTPLGKFDILFRPLPMLLRHTPRLTPLTSLSKTCGLTQRVGSTVCRHSGRLIDLWEENTLASASGQFHLR